MCIILYAFCTKNYASYILTPSLRSAVSSLSLSEELVIRTSVFLTSVILAKTSLPIFEQSATTIILMHDENQELNLSADKVKITFFETKILLPLNIFKRGIMRFKWVSDKWEIFK